MRFLMKRALINILTILSLFSITLIVNTAEAQQNVCCERTNSGDYCVYTSQGNCNPNYNIAATTCSQTSFCQLVCCIDTNNGEIFPNVYAASCYNTPNKTMNANDPSCSNIPRGCCQIGNQCNIKTESNCNHLASQYGIQPNFNPNINNEAQCINQCQLQDEGCCILPRNLCEYTTREECSTAGQENTQGTSGFYQNTYCSNPRLSCNCEPHARKGCVPNEDDAYWFDSCGNPEEIAEDCDYVQGTLCRENGGSATCASVNCLDTSDFPKNTHDPNMGGFRKNGESWCVYESPIGTSLDFVGSRHYKHLCVNGEELIEPCRDFREQYCIQGNIQFNEGTYIQASCLDNKYKECVDECRNKGNKEKNKQCCESKSYCTWMGEDNEGLGGSCYPSVSPGLKFWPDEEGEIDEEVKSVCNKGDTQCTSYWIKNEFTHHKECIKNCECEKKIWVQDMNMLCRSLGDCGAWYNVDEVFTLAGQSTSGPRTAKLELSDAPEIDLLWDLSSNYLNIGDYSTGESFFDYYHEHYGQYWLWPFGNTRLGRWFSRVDYKLDKFFGFINKKKYVHKFDCEPWVPPSEGNYCDRCDKDPNFECSEYKCRSLGASCRLVNEGTGEEKCVSDNPNDVNSPVISPWHEILTQGYNTELTETGYLITPLVPAYSPIRFGIKLNELAQCKVDTQHTQSYDEMINYFGRSIYQKEKNVTLILPGGRDYAYYIRCQDTHGNKNIAEYTIQFSTAREPDLTPPVIDHTSIGNNAYITSGISELNITSFINEPGYCKWSRSDEGYEFMPYEMACEDENIENPTFFSLYECETTLTNINSAQENKYYLRCEDLAGNKNQQSYQLTLIGTTPLNIISAEPAGELFISSPTLRIVTQNGAENGKATCEFSNDNVNFIEFINTNSNIHTQPLINLTLGQYFYYVRCTDIAENEAFTTINFAVSIDEIPPTIIYIYESGDVIIVVTNENSSCRYSLNNPNFSFENGIATSGDNTNEHSISELNSIYHLKCRDQFENMGSYTIYR